jgi:host factor-I protein
MSTITGDVEADFLDTSGLNGKIVWVFLVNGIRLTGSISAFDRHTILLHSGTGVLMIYKHAISTVCEPYERMFPVQDGSASVTPGPRVARRDPRR